MYGGERGSFGPFYSLMDDYAILQLCYFTQVQYPKGIKTGYSTFKHIHDKKKRPRDQKLYHNQREVCSLINVTIHLGIHGTIYMQMSTRRDRKTGLNTLTYTKVHDLEITISGAPFHFVSVELNCDYKLTPFCDTPS